MEDGYYGTGKRKASIARVWLRPGEGNIIVNNTNLMDHFKRETLEAIIKQPLVAADVLGSYDIKATVRGGGLSGQSGALRLGITRALAECDPELRPVLKKGGFFTRDARVVERKKYGQPGARKHFQFSKR